MAKNSLFKIRYSSVFLVAVVTRLSKNFKLDLELLISATDL